MFLKRYDLRVKFLINYQTVCLEQMYTIFLNFADNYYQQYYNVLILLLSEEHSRHFFLQLFNFQCFQVISLFQVLKAQDNIHFNFKCNPIFIFTYKHFDWWVINTCTMFFKNILKTILNI